MFSEVGELVLHSCAHRPSILVTMQWCGGCATPAHVRLCRAAMFQSVLNSGFQQFFLFGWGNVSSGPSKPYIVIPIDCVDWHLAGRGQSQESGVRAARPTNRS